MAGLTVAILLAVHGGACAQSDAGTSAEDLAKKLSNPIASLISVPFQNNVDFGGGGAVRDTLNVQPVIPISLNNDWLLITRNIVPIIGMNSSFSPTGQGAFGMGDITSSFFFSPKQPTSGGWIWGVGPVALLPVATERVLGGGKLGLGPTGVVLKQMAAGPMARSPIKSGRWPVPTDARRSVRRSSSRSSPIRGKAVSR